MRIALISDIHGNLPALDAVLSEIDSFDNETNKMIDRIICLGDIVDLGPQPQEVLQRLRSRNIECIKGNHDPLTEEPPPVPVLKSIMETSKTLLNDDDHHYLAQLPISMLVKLSNNSVHNPESTSAPQLLCVHGSPRSNTEGITAGLTDEELDKILDGLDFDVLACGHTHVQMVRKWRGKMIVNVGSIGFPFEKSPTKPGEPPQVCPWAEYAILESFDGSFPGHINVSLRRVAYNVDDYRQAASKVFGSSDAVFL